MKRATIKPAMTKLLRLNIVPKSAPILFTALFGVVSNPSLATPSFSDQNRSTQSTLSQNVTADVENQSRCEKQLDYQLYINRFDIGRVKKVETVQGNELSITSNSRSNVLGIKTQFDQTTQLRFNPKNRVWTTQSYHQIVSGFRNRDMNVNYLNIMGTQTSVNLDGEIDSYQSPEPIFDIDGLSLEIVRRVIAGEKEFKLSRQATTHLEPYEYQVLGAFTEKTENWGEIKVIKVEQSGSDDITYWIAPDLENEIVRVIYHRILFSGEARLRSIFEECH
ncbi:DUF3108 domain-containing protein [Vibrio sp. SS-MA-C1-2]|uniref:DUF3108 domain-containing protein n=1 Tax=Vibrio sp. SS-MA-C1-2 TaxID=2908646 RepID=UPI001F32CB4D|nr:DUF3108 domain-containing protein [Vibrio sp. SS-MA-C1-2]UJF18558.1 DUF3108 domain-containing protein [Vibrio sp. SS-MA-C1-2]